MDCWKNHSNADFLTNCWTFANRKKLTQGLDEAKPIKSGIRNHYESQGGLSPVWQSCRPGFFFCIRSWSAEIIFRYGLMASSMECGDAITAMVLSLQRTLGIGRKHKPSNASTIRQPFADSSAFEFFDHTASFSQFLFLPVCRYPLPSNQSIGVFGKCRRSEWTCSSVRVISSKFM